MPASPKIHRPADCGLAVTYPLSYTTFRADYLRPHGHRRFPRDYGDQACVPGASAWEVWRAFAPVASQIRAMCRYVARLGVTVRTDANLDDVRTLFRTCRVVTLFSHARFPTFEVADLLDPAGIATRLEWARQEAAQTPAGIFLRAAGQEWYAYVAFNKLDLLQLDEIGLQQALCSCFNALIKRDQKGVFFRPGADVRDHDREAISKSALSEAEAGPLVRFSRPDFEIVFPTEVEARPLVDFADGVRSFRDLAGLIPASFQGEADLSICHSAVLGEFLKSKDGQRIPCVVIVNRPGSHIAARVWIYRHTISLLGAKDAALSYVAANDLVRKKPISRDEV